MSLSSLQPQPPSDWKQDVPDRSEAAFARFNKLPEILKQYWITLVGVPLIVGTLALGIGYLLNKDYVSSAYIGPIDEKGSRLASSIIYSPKVLEKTLQSFPDYPPVDQDVYERRRRLASKIRWVSARGSDPKQLGLYVLEVQDKVPERAQALAKQIIENWLLELSPPQDEKGRLERSLVTTELLSDQLSSLTTELMRRPDALFSDGKSSLSVLNSADLFRLRADAAAKIEDIKAKLAGGTRDWIYMAPLAAVPVSWNRASIFLSTVILSFSALLAGLYWRNIRSVRTYRTPPA